MKFQSPQRSPRTRARGYAIGAFGLLAAVALMGRALAEDLPTGNLADLSIEQLMDVSVTSVSKKEQRLSDAAAAITVLSNDDLRRSGFTTVADALRLVPGLQVASLDSDTWAISARGFSSQFANKLLVTIDGRSVYSPAFSGVYWDAQHVFLDDVDRVEVIRGPGASIWGANAVNGVISIISKSARDTQGGLVYGGGGNVDLTSDGARSGGKIGDDTYYRIYGMYQRNDDFRQASGGSAADAWDMGQGGFRMDHYTHRDGQLTWQGDYYRGNLADHTGDKSGLNALGRWTQRFSERSSYELQAYFDHTYRNDFLARSSVDTTDLSWQQTFGLGERNDAIWGLGDRFSEVRVKSNTPGLTVLNNGVPLNLYSAFIQDDVKVIPDTLTLTLGTKIEHNNYTGIEWEPNARLVFKLAKIQTIWASVSRAVRIPSYAEAEDSVLFATGAPIVGPDGNLYVPTVFGNSQLQSEVLWAYELGYRIQAADRVSVEVALFSNRYTDIVGQLPTGVLTPGAPVGILRIEDGNSISCDSYGGEAVVTAAVTDFWRLSASYSFVKIDARGEPVASIQSLSSGTPTNQVVLRSSYDFARHFSLDADFRYVDKITGVPSYATADVRFSYRPKANVELSISGQNLLDGSHPEQTGLIGGPTAEVPRRFQGKITLRF